MLASASATRRRRRKTRERCVKRWIPDDAGAVTDEEGEVTMPQPIVAVGVDPAKRLHRAVAVLFPDQVVLNVELPNAYDAIAKLDDRLSELANQHRAELVYGLEDHRRYGQLFCQVWTERGREVRVVNPLWTSRQRAFYGQDKDDAIDGRSIAAVVLRRHHELPLATDFGEVAQAVREAERSLQDLDKTRTGRRTGCIFNSVTPTPPFMRGFSVSCEARLRCASSVASRSHKTWLATMSRCWPACCSNWPAAKWDRTKAPTG
jgi:hypothetical protein